MIPVVLQPDPASFQEAVRVKGLAHLASCGLALNQPLPAKTTIEPYWRACLTDLHKAYSGVCAYLGVYFERVMGGGSVDHFIAKSKDAGLAYEWDNYRLACATMNTRKGNYSHVLDPFFLAPDSFRLELSTGHIFGNPNLSTGALTLANTTIARLKLDDSQCRELRARWFQAYIENHVSSQYLQAKSPFVWTEADRQGLL